MILELDPRSILLAPEVFQYKISGIVDNEAGVTVTLKSVRKWNPYLAGVVLVYIDHANKLKKGSGKIFAVNGHHRTELAQRLGVKKIFAMPIEVRTPQEARTMGALANIAEGRGTAIDAAKFLKDAKAGQLLLTENGISLTERIAQEGLFLSGLSDDLFSLVAQGRFPETKAIIIGANIGRASLQEQAFKAYLASKNSMSDNTLLELCLMLNNTPTQVKELNTLFGTTKEEYALISQKAELFAAVQSQIRQDIEVFGGLIRNENRITNQSSNVLNKEQNSSIAQRGKYRQTYWNAYKFGRDINELTNSFLNKKITSKVKTDYVKAVFDYLDSQIQTKDTHSKSAPLQKRGEIVELEQRLKLLKFI